MNTIETLAAVQHFGIRANKKYGQNFLTDEGVLDGIIQAAAVSPADTVLEIGPGLGALTKKLSHAARKVISVEIDEGLLPVLSETLRDADNVTVRLADILETDIPGLLSEALVTPGTPVKVVANLPYYITTPILFRLFSCLEAKTAKPPLLSSITVMVQREVAARLTAGPGTKDYGALSLAAAYYTEPEICLYVPAEAFYPPPKVESAVVSMRCLREPPVSTEDPAFLFAVIRAAFNQRRKTLVNALKNAPELKIEKADVLRALARLQKPDNVRGETLTLEEYALLTAFLHS